MLPDDLTNWRQAFRRGHSKELGLGAMGLVTKTHVHECYRDRVNTTYVAIYLISGHGVAIDHAGVEHPVAAGDLIQHPPGHRSGLVPNVDTRWTEVYLNLGPDYARSLAAIGVLDLTRTVLHPGFDLALARQFTDLLDRLAVARDHELPQLATVTGRLLAECYQRDHRSAGHAPDDQLDRAVAMLTDGHRPSDVAEAISLDYQVFRKRFRRRFGISPGAYRIRRRIDQACKRLLQSEDTTADIAADLGYPDAFAFSKQFKRHVGVSPTHFREQHS